MEYIYLKMRVEKNLSFCIKKLILIEGLNGGESSVAGARRNQRASSRNRLLSPQPPVKIDLQFIFKFIFKRFLDVSSIIRFFIYKSVSSSLKVDFILLKYNFLIRETPVDRPRVTLNWNQPQKQ